MKSNLTAITLLWHLVNVSPLKAAISGSVYKIKRPVNINSEDIVINALPINSEQLQQGVLNVNIHVPNMVIKNGTVTDETLPNTARLEALSVVAGDFFQNDLWGDGYCFALQQQNVFPDENGKAYYINLRVQFFNVNL